MRIIHELQAGASVLEFGWGRCRAGAPPVQAYVTIDEIAGWYWSSPKMHWDINNDFGPMRCPFDSMWIEWEYPRDMALSLDTVNHEVPQGAGRFIQKWSDENVKEMEFDGGDPDPEVVEWISVRRFGRMRGQGIVVPPWWAVMGISEDGRMVDRRVQILDEKAFAAYAMDIGDITEHEVMLALSFMNVVNARRDDEPEHRHTTKALKKKGVVPIAMNRIRLPAAKSSSRSDVKAATGGTMPLHLVRGHFKTYTADAPLFGRNTGTYWWGWQSRGKAERGVRGHTYEVGTG